MPTWLDLLIDPVTWAFFGLYFSLWGLEALFPARPLPKVPGHRTRGVLALVVFFLISAYVTLALAPFLSPLRLADLSNLGTWGGAACVMLVYQLLAYGYHRAMHASDALFRVLHQVHHSSERLDVASAFWFSPLDMLGWTLVSSLASGVFGVTAQASLVLVLTGTFLSVFQHANLRTPRWLGYVIQRPESHSHHHARGVHRNNYADLPLIDLLFGTFVNPAEFAAETGYYPGASAHFIAMMFGGDRTRPGAEATQVAPSAPSCVTAPLPRSSSRPVFQRVSQDAKAPPVLSGSQPH